MGCLGFMLKLSFEHLMDSLLVSLDTMWSGYCCFIGICFPVLQRRPTPELILKMRILVSKQRRIPNFRAYPTLIRIHRLSCNSIKRNHYQFLLMETNEIRRLKFLN